MTHRQRLDPQRWTTADCVELCVHSHSEPGIAHGLSLYNPERGSSYHSDFKLVNCRPLCLTYSALPILTQLCESQIARVSTRTLLLRGGANQFGGCGRLPRMDGVILSGIKRS